MVRSTLQSLAKTVQVHSLKALTLGRIIQNFIVITLAGNESVLGYLDLKWSVQTSHGDSRPLIALQCGFPKQG